MTADGYIMWPYKLPMLLNYVRLGIFEYFCSFLKKFRALSLNNLFAFKVF